GVGLVRFRECRVAALVDEEPIETAVDDSLKELLRPPARHVLDPGIRFPSLHRPETPRQRLGVDVPPAVFVGRHLEYRRAFGVRLVRQTKHLRSRLEGSLDLAKKLSIGTEPIGLLIERAGNAGPEPRRWRLIEKTHQEDRTPHEVGCRDSP